MTRSWNPVDRRIGLGIAACGLVTVLLNADVFAGEASRFDPWWLALAAGVPLLQCVSLVGGMLLPARTLRALWLLQSPLFLVVLLLSFLAWKGEVGLPRTLQVWLVDSTVVVAAALVLRLRDALAVTLLLAAATPVSALLFLGWVPRKVLGGGFINAAGIIYVMVVLVLREQLIRLSQARSAASQLRTEEQRARAESEEFERFARTVHDEVLSTFGAAVQFEGEPPPLLRNSATVALQALERDDGEPGGEPLELTTRQAEQLVRRLTAAAAASVSINSQISPGRVPAAAAGALGLAAAEAARNAARHAGGGIGTLMAADGSLRIAIIDTGPGFDPRRIETGRFGLRESILKRVESLPGGKVSIDTGPGGTTVVMSWSRTAK